MSEKRITMNIGIACAIFDNIDSEAFSDIEKAGAIHDVLSMPTHNSVTKEAMLKVIAWLWDMVFEWEDEAE